MTVSDVLVGYGFDVLFPGIDLEFNVRSSFFAQADGYVELVRADVEQWLRERIHAWGRPEEEIEPYLAGPLVEVTWEEGSLRVKAVLTAACAALLLGGCTVAQRPTYHQETIIVLQHVEQTAANRLGEANGGLISRDVHPGGIAEVDIVMQRVRRGEAGPQEVAKVIVETFEPLLSREARIPDDPNDVTEEPSVAWPLAEYIEERYAPETRAAYGELEAVPLDHPVKTRVEVHVEPNSLDVTVDAERVKVTITEVVSEPLPPPPPPEPTVSVAVVAGVIFGIAVGLYEAIANYKDFLEGLALLRAHVTMLRERIEKALGKQYKVVRVRQTPPPPRRRRKP